MVLAETLATYGIAVAPTVGSGHIVFAATWTNRSEFEGYACVDAAVIASGAGYWAGAVVVSLDEVADRHCV